MKSQNEQITMFGHKHLSLILSSQTDDKVKSYYQSHRHSRNQSLRLSCLFLEFLEVVDGWRRRIFKTFVAGLTDRHGMTGVVPWQRDVAVNAAIAVDVSTAPTVMLLNTNTHTVSTRNEPMKQGQPSLGTKIHNHKSLMRQPPSSSS